MPQKACKTATFGIHKAGQKSTSIIKSRVLIFYEEFVKTFFLKFSCKHIFLADLPVLCYIYYQQLDLFFNYKPCIYMKVESNL